MAVGLILNYESVALVCCSEEGDEPKGKAPDVHLHILDLWSGEMDQYRMTLDSKQLEQATLAWFDLAIEKWRGALVVFTY